jgi:hypothetical protein
MSSIKIKEDNGGGLLRLNHITRSRFPEESNQLDFDKRSQSFVSAAFALLRVTRCFLKKATKFFPNFPKNGAFASNSFYPKKLVIKIWEFTDKKYLKSGAYLG